MALTNLNLGYIPSAGVNYTVTTSGITDWTGVTGTTYFYDLVDKLPYLKTNGNVYHIFTGSTTGSTDTYVTGFTYSSNVLTIKQNGQTDLTATINTLTGLTINGYLNVTGNTTLNGLTATTISATTYVNLPIDIRVTGGTYSNGITTFTNNTGGTFNVTGYYTGATDVYVTGGTYSAGIATFINNTGGTFLVSGFTTGSTDTYVTGFTYSSNTFTIKQNNGQSDLSVVANTMTGLTVNGLLKSTTISATSINTVDYIIFNTGTTSATTVPGTVYFDNTEKALSYNTSINQGVTVNLGQQNYIRVINNSGTAIQRGKALELLTAFSGLPAVTLAINRKNGSNIIGVSSEIIPNGDEGIAITNGIISDIQLTGMSVGSLIYASDTTPGNLVDATQYLNFPLTARTNQIGYVIQTGITTGKLFVNINNENTVLSLTDLQRNVLEGNVISTGVFEFTGITQYSSTTINISNIKGWIVKNTYGNAITPDVIYVEYSGGTNISLPNLTTADSTFILINSASTIVQQTTFPTPQQRRENIYLGKVVHPNRLTITSVNNTVDFDVSPMSALRDLWTPLKLINQGILVSPNGANLNINTSAGTLWGNGIGWVSNQLNPDSLSISGTSPTTFQYRVQTGGTFSNTTTIDVANYDLNGVVTAVGGGAGSSTNQRVYLFPTGLVRIQYGQTVYGTLAAAVAGIQTESFIEYGNNRDNGILIGIISVNKNATLLNNTAQAIFTLVSKFGELLGGTGGLSTTTLQQAYDNSTTPEITINSTLDGLSIKNGTGNADNVTRLLEGITATNDVTSFIRADGYITGTTFQSNGFIGNSGGATATTLNIVTLGSGTSITNLGIDVTGRVVTGTTGSSVFTGGTVNGATIFTNGLTANTISATTYYNLPTDVYVTGGTYSLGTATFTNNTGGTFSVTGFSSGGGMLGEYLPLSGGTVTGATIFQSGLTANTIYTDYVDFNTGYTGNVVEGRLQWDNGNGTLVLGLKGGVSDIEIGLENMALCYNDEVTTLSAGTIVYVSGSQGNRPSIKRAIATSDGYSITTLGMVSEPIASGSEGFVTTFGMVNKLNTIGLTGGTPIWLSPSVSGGYTSVKPQAPDHTVLIGYVVRISATVGSVFIHISNGWELDELHDVRITGATQGDILTLSGYSGSNVWVNSKTLNGSYTITGDTTIGGNLTATTISATTYQNLPTDIRVTGATYSNNTFTYTNNTGGTFNVLFNTLTGLTVNGNLTVTGNTLVRGLTGTTATISGSGQNILTVIGSGTTSPLFSVIGSSGELFSVTDSLTGSLFSVNDISGLPILEVFSDNTTLMGNYLAPSLNTTARVTLTAGTNTVYSIPTSAYTGAFFDYTLVSTGTTGARAGNIMSIWSGSSAQYTEVSTNSIGTTTGVTFSVAVSGNNAVLSSSATTAGWTLKTIIRSI